MGQLTKNINQPSYGNDLFQAPVGSGAIIGFTSNHGATGRYDTLQTLDNVQYIVPVGKKLIIFSVIGTTGNSSSGSSLGVGYADTAPTDTASAPTNPKSISRACFPVFQLSTSMNAKPNSCYIEIPAGKYPVALTNGNGGSGYYLGILVDV